MQPSFQTQSNHVHACTSVFQPNSIQPYSIQDKDKLSDFDDITWGISDGTSETIMKKKLQLSQIKLMLYIKQFS